MTIFHVKGCENGFYKNTIENSKCKKCPDGKTNNTMHTECDCKKDHKLGKDVKGSCYGM